MGSSSAHGHILTAGSEPASLRGEREIGLEPRDERIKRVDEGSEMSSLEPRTPRASSLAGRSQERRYALL